MGSLPLYASVRTLDPEAFSGESRVVVDFLAAYYHDVDKYPVRAADLEPGRLRKRLPDAAPEHGEPLERVLVDVRRDILPWLTHWQSPSFFCALLFVSQARVLFPAGHVNMQCSTWPLNEIETLDQPFCSSDASLTNLRNCTI
ncbi:unnamed protein product [Urochloa humidicola]